MSADDHSLMSLRQQIANSFAACMPPDAGLVVIDSADHDIEGREVRDAFTGTRWQDVDARMVTAFKDALPLFTPRGFAYFLPAYLLACLNAPQQVDTALDSVLFNLTPPRPRRGWRWKFFESRASLFDAAQARAIAAFLDWQARIEAKDWASDGKMPPPERIGHALSYWQDAVKKTSGPR